MFLFISSPIVLTIQSIILFELVSSYPAFHTARVGLCEHILFITATTRCFLQRYIGLVQLASDTNPVIVHFELPLPHWGQIKNVRHCYDLGNLGRDRAPSLRMRSRRALCVTVYIAFFVGSTKPAVPFVVPSSRPNPLHHRRRGRASFGRPDGERVIPEYNNRNSKKSSQILCFLIMFRTQFNCSLRCIGGTETSQYLSVMYHLRGVPGLYRHVRCHKHIAGNNPEVDKNIKIVLTGGVVVVIS